MGAQGDEIESLFDAVVDGRCDEAGLRRFEELVRDDPKAREAYLEQMRMHALLEWRFGRAGAPDDGVNVGVDRGRGRWWGPGWPRWALAALVLVAVGLVIQASRSGRLGRGGGAVATLVEARDVVWDGGQPPIAVNARLGPREIRCRSGTLRLAFDSGASVTLEGPADLQIVSGMRLRARRGRITARVRGELKGFSVETPSTLVVDQGTEFGVEVDDSGRTGVVVFEGLVDLARAEAADGPAPIKRLVQGEAMRVDRAGALSRIVSVERRAGGDVWSTGPSADREAVIRSVRDNIRGLDSAKYYQIVPRGLADDATAYVDRPHQWNGLDEHGLPEFLRGADYVMPFNDDKWLSDLEITVELARAATLYVFLDVREQPPEWLTGRFLDTGVKIGLDEGSWPDPTLYFVDTGSGRSIDHVFTVWSRDVGPNESITLGALSGGKNNRAMYGIAAVARP
jgi:hypothetical protein